MIRVVLLDDEPHSIETLSWKLDKFCPEVKIIGKYNDPEIGLEAIRKDPPDLLFLDIEMPKLNGFEVLEELGELSFDVIFTTAYDEYGIRAIKFSALDYLLKPIQNNELKNAVEKFQQKDTKFISNRQLEALLHNYREPTGKSPRIALATQESIELVSPEDIITCASDSNYTIVYLTDERKKIIAKTLKEFEEMLSEYNFFRTHHSHLANLDHVREYVRSEGGYLTMSNQMTVPVSRSKREALLKLF